MKRKRFLKSGFLIPIFGILILFPVHAFGAGMGDVNGSQEIDLGDIIVALQICAGMTPASEIHTEASVNGNDTIDLAEAIFALQVVAGIGETLFMVEGDNPVSIDLSLTEPSTAQSILETVLPDGQAAILIRKNVIARDESDYTWSGEIGGKEHSTVVLSVVDEAMFGHITTENGSYFIQPEGESYRVVKHDPAQLAPHGDDAIALDPEDLKKSFRRNVLKDSEDGSFIDVMVLYTAQMQAKYGSNLNALIQHFVDLTNQAYKNSGVDTQLRLVHTELYADSATQEGKDNTSALYHIKGSANVEAIRDEYKADMVSLLRVYSGTGDSCGVGFIMGSGWVGPQFGPLAFSVVEVLPMNEANPYYCSEFTFAHELGHNLGCAHDEDHANVEGAFAYSYGYDISGEFATIMSYDSPEILYFSTPEVSYQGNRIGKDVGEPDSAYNALTINNTRGIVANFRVADNYVLFPDESLEAVIREKIGKPSGDILISDVQNISTLEAENRGIQDIEGLQYCTGLTELNLYGNGISDIGVLSGLTNLEKLTLSFNHEISDISALSGLTNLTELYIHDNLISDISPLSGLTNLRIVNLSVNQISDISVLSSLKNLEELYIHDNQISDISVLSQLTGLRKLNISNNKVSDVSALSGLTSMTWLYLHDNQISDVSPLSGMTSLKTVNLENNPLTPSSCGVHIPALGNSGVTVLENTCIVLFPDENLEAVIRAKISKATGDIFVSDVMNISVLEAVEKGIQDIEGLQYCTGLTELNLYGNGISDIGVLSGLTNLEKLTLSFNHEISDIIAISGLTKLTEFYIYNNKITDISPLSGLTNLRIVNLSVNQISDISVLSSLKNLEELYIHDNQVSDISLLSQLTGLRKLNISNNKVSDVTALSGLTSITWMYLHDNQIEDVSPLSGMTSLKTVNLENNPLNTTSCNVHIPALESRGVTVYHNCNDSLCVLLQNKTISGGSPVEVSSAECIKAGRSVNPDESEGKYVIGPGGNVTMRAGKIYLKHGFEAEEGCKFSATAE